MSNLAEQHNTPLYDEIRTCTESYFDRIGDHPTGVGWPNEADALVRYQVMLDVIRESPAQPLTLLDFGCGLGHLYEYLQSQSLPMIDYVGVDLSDRFVQQCRSKHPGVQFCCYDLLKNSERTPQFDYAVINGVFTSKCSMTFEQMFSFVREIVTTLFLKANCGLAFNTISKHVDWERDDLFHLPLDDLAAFLCKDVSRNFVIRNDYGLYEQTIYVYK